MADIFLFRRKTAADWTAANPVLMSGELGLETDTGLFKFGNGSATWTARPYAGASVGVVPWGSITGTLTAQADLVAALGAKQATLVAGTNIKTINGSTILGSGDMVISGGGLSDGDKGDITVTGSGATWTIDAGVVSYSKMQSVSAASKLLGRGDSGSGSPQEITLGSGLTMTGTTLSSSGGGGVSDGDKGDITVSGGGTVWTIDAGAVTLAKQADMATASVVYRKTAGAGAPEVQTLATLKTDLGLTGTNSGDQTITLTGDVTGSGTGSFAATLATVNANVGSFGSATQVATFTANAKGLMTAAANVAISIPATAISDSTAAGRAMVTAATATAQTALLDVFTSGAKGLVPASGGGTANFLRADGTFAAPTAAFDFGTNAAMAGLLTY